MTENALLVIGGSDAELISVVRNSGFRLDDLRHFANQAYWPQETDHVHALPADGRRAIFEERYRTDYAVVDPDVSVGLHQAWYDGEVSGRQRLTMLKRTVVTAAEDRGGTVRVHLRERYTGAESSVDVEAVILGTGFAEERVPAVLEPMREHVATDEDGLPEVRRDFRLGLTSPAPVHLYLNGRSERWHGIASATSFSLLAVRAGEITASARAACVPTVLAPTR